MKRFFTLFILVGACVVGGYFFFTSGGATLPNLGFESTPTDCGQLVEDTCIKYEDSRYPFSVFRPAAQQVQTYDEGSGAETITFQDVKDSRGFQMYVLPYPDTQITAERFRLDVPSGVQEDLRNAVVGGATAAVFYSKNAVLGDTYEVWIIHGGYLYEVTTVRSLEPMLNAILATWRFK